MTLDFDIRGKVLDSFPALIGDIVSTSVGTGKVVGTQFFENDVTTHLLVRLIDGQLVKVNLEDTEVVV